jgi:soluble lytic murein transglycosylase
MKRYRDASVSYRRFGSYYPEDRRAEMSTDMSARIEVASGRWDSAVDTWRRIADAGPETLIGREALLGMAVVLERTGRKDEACRILLENREGVRGRIKSAYLYWIARTCSDEKTVSDISGQLSRMFAGSFYSTVLEKGPGFLNADRVIESVPAIARKEAETRTEPFPGTGNPPYHPSLGAFRYFAVSGLKSRAAECATVYVDRLDSTARAACLGTIYEEAREAGLESLCLRLAVDNTGLFAGREDYIEFLYPFAYGTVIDRYSSERRLPPELVLAVIREESRFDETVMSPAGAWGLMQVMPSTGEWIGGKLGRKDIDVSDLLDPDFNVEAGCWYLRFLLDRADESIVGTLAAYNAGHGRMRAWKKKFSPHRDPMAAIELIGPSETRQYVRRVLDSMSSYSRGDR